MHKCKKIIIVTVYNSYNFGSILQAAALSELLCQYGSVCFLKTGARKGHLIGFKFIIKAIFHFQIKRLLFECKNLLNFFRITGNFKTISIKEANNACAFYCFGSDEIWNISRKDISEYPIFWGAGLFGKRKIAYAPSINNTKEKQLSGTHFIECLKNFEMIAVRDSYSQKILKKLSGKDIQVVLDPTMLVDYTQKKSPSKKSHYIGTYIFESKFKDSNAGVKSLKNIASFYNKELVSIGVWRRWADQNYTSIMQSPFDYYINADYILTNTFHGTLFAILYKKQFVVFVDKNQKIKELLKCFDLENHMVNEFMDIKQICAILESKIDYAKINRCLEEKKAFSINYIKNSFYD